MDNCCDLIASLPHIISVQVFSYLDPVSLARACQVNQRWNELGSDGLLWKRWCFMPKWRFSAATEEKQQIKYRDPVDNSIQVISKSCFSQQSSLLIYFIFSKWKKIFSEKFRVKRNWLTGKSFVKTFYGHEGAVSCVQFDDSRIVAGSAVGTIKWVFESKFISSNCLYLIYLSI